MKPLEGDTEFDTFTEINDLEDGDEVAVYTFERLCTIRVHTEKVLED